MADSLYQKYIQMHKNIPVAEFELDNASASVSAIGEIYAPAHVPVGMAVKKGRIDRTALNEWWKGRAFVAVDNLSADVGEDIAYSGSDKELDR